MATTVCAAVIVGFNPAIYTFAEEDGAVNLTLEVTGFNGDLECDINVTVILFDGTKASKYHTGLVLPPIQQQYLIFFIFSVVRGMDYESADPLIVTLPATSTPNGHTYIVTLDILNDEAVEGTHNFTAAVQNSSLITPASPATINIIDNDSELQ